MALSKEYIEKVRKGKVARFFQDIKDMIIARDNGCILCDNEDNNIIDPHHVLFGLQTKFDTDRNTIKNGVCVCRQCHNTIHGTRSGQGKRQQCIDYINNLYYE